jgi:hypothetical protein
MVGIGIYVDSRRLAAEIRLSASKLAELTQNPFACSKYKEYLVGRGWLKLSVGEQLRFIRQHHFPASSKESSCMMKLLMLVYEIVQARKDTTVLQVIFSKS